MTCRAAILLLLVFHGSALFAQDDRGASVSGSVSATNLDSRTSWSFAGSFEYRINRAAGLEIEATVIPTLESDFPGFRILAQPAVLAPSRPSGLVAPVIFPPPRFENQRGRAVFFTNNVRVHIPTTIDRIDPFFIAGAGLANVRHRADYVFPLSPLAIPIRPIPQPISSSSTNLALTIGGGVAVRAMPKLWIEGDLRMFRLLGEEDRNAGRFGLGARYRF